MSAYAAMERLRIILDMLELAQTNRAKPADICEIREEDEKALVTADEARKPNWIQRALNQLEDDEERDFMNKLFAPSESSKKNNPAAADIVDVPNQEMAEMKTTANAIYRFTPCEENAPTLPARADNALARPARVESGAVPKTQQPRIILAARGEKREDLRARSQSKEDKAQAIIAEFRQVKEQAHSQEIVENALFDKVDKFIEAYGKDLLQPILRGISNRKEQRKAMSEIAEKQKRWKELEQEKLEHYRKGLELAEKEQQLRTSTRDNSRDKCYVCQMPGVRRGRDCPQLHSHAKIIAEKKQQGSWQQH